VENSNMAGTLMGYYFPSVGSIEQLLSHMTSYRNPLLAINVKVVNGASGGHAAFHRK
jgi:hypothetical protein